LVGQLREFEFLSKELLVGYELCRAEQSTPHQSALGRAIEKQGMQACDVPLHGQMALKAPIPTTQSRQGNRPWPLVPLCNRELQAAGRHGSPVHCTLHVDGWTFLRIYAA
jgi:hypothetical protein